MHQQQKSVLFHTWEWSFFVFFSFLSFLFDYLCFDLTNESFWINRQLIALEQSIRSITNWVVYWRKQNTHPLEQLLSMGDFDWIQLNMKNPSVVRSLIWSNVFLLVISQQTRPEMELEDILPTMQFSDQITCTVVCITRQRSASLFFTRDCCIFLSALGKFDHAEIGSCLSLLQLIM